MPSKFSSEISTSGQQHHIQSRSVVNEHYMRSVLSPFRMHPQTATYYNAEERIWSGPRRKDLYNAVITLGEVISDALAKHPQKVIQINDVTGEKLTSGELLHLAEALSRNLLQLGLKPGDVVGLYAGNWTHATTLMLASFLCGMPVNALYPEFDKESVSMIFKVTRPKIIFCDADNYETAAKVNEELQLKAWLYVFNGDLKGVAHIEDLLVFEKATEGEEFRYPCVDLQGDDTAVILCSSGTTGLPKGVLCSHRALLNQRIYLTLKSDSVLFTFSTMYWASGLWSVLAQLMNACLRIVTTRPYSPQYFLDLMKLYKITHITTNVTHMGELVSQIHPEDIREGLASIDTIVVGGSKVPLALQEKMNSILADNTRRSGFSVSYGMSELSGLLSENTEFDRMEGTEGKLMANNEVCIIDKDGQRLGPMEQGEICIHSPYSWKGYYNNPEATRKAIIGNWLHSGDIGYFDNEGFLHVCGRDNDVFKARNFQIYPQIIEEVIFRLKGVAETCVFGIPDLVASHLIACAVVRAKDQQGSQLTAEEIEQHVKANLGKMYQLSGGVYFMDAIPKTGSGKVQRQKVLQMVLQAK